MSRGINKVILVGKDPEMKYAANGNAITTLSVATSEQAHGGVENDFGDDDVPF